MAVLDSGSPVRPEDMKQSQYFDALETIKEEDQVAILRISHFGKKIDQFLSYSYGQDFIRKYE
jgi:hypothetical protein